MKLLLYLADQNPQRDRSRGITGYSEGLISNLHADPGFEVSLMTSKSSYHCKDGGREIELPFRTDNLPGRIIADWLHPLWFPKGALFHYPKGFLPGMRPSGGAVFGTVHDVILQHYADHYPHARSKFAYTYWLQALKRSLPRFDMILTVSEFSASAIRTFCERHHLICPPIRVTYQGCRWEGSALEKRPRFDQVVHLASAEPHKRTATLVEYWQKVAPPNLRLIMIGTTTDEVQRRIAADKSIVILPHLPEEELKALIKQSRALLLPSEVEGFGLPALEAYAVGTPVVYVLGTAVHEVLGEQRPGGFTLQSPDSFAAALLAAVNLPEGEIEAAAAQLSARFSWGECTRRTVAAYREIGTNL